MDLIGAEVTARCERLTVLALTLALSSCGGNDQVMVASDDERIVSPQLTLDDGIVADTGPLLFVTSSTATDLSIAAVAAPELNSAHWSFRITIGDNDTDSYSRENLSFMLELSRQIDFSTSYRTALFDLIFNADDTISARAKLPALPSDVYFARLEVNPDWGMYLENQFDDSNLSQSLHYIDEAIVTNNYSEVFSLELQSTIVCDEDLFESQSGAGNAPELISGGSITASLCLDNADYYRFGLLQNDRTVITLEQLGDPVTTRYALVDPNSNITRTGLILGVSKDIPITAEQSGDHFIAIYGNRTTYQLSRDLHATPNPEWFFSTDTVTGPLSPVYGQITLNRLQFTRSGLTGQAIHCSRHVIDPISGDRYITPPHFPEIHTYRFAENNLYYVDDERHLDWSASGDITSAEWYDNLYYGWAENIGDGGWRYWNFEGVAFVQCNFM